MIVLPHFHYDNDDREFDTAIKGKGKGPGIIEAMELGDGHRRHGCSTGTMDDWVELMKP